MILKRGSRPSVIMNAQLESPVSEQITSKQIECEQYVPYGEAQPTKFLP